MIYYIHNTEQNSIGVIKKIEGQIRAFEHYGYVICEFIINNKYSIWEKVLDRLDVFCLWHKLNINININDIKPGSTIYFRFIPLNYNILKLFKFLKNELNCTIIMEIPTFPYRNELKYLFTRLQLSTLVQDVICWKFVHPYIDKIVTYSEDKYINGIATIITDNGIDTNTILPQKNISFNKELQVIAVAQIAFWHGYDRFIEGLKIYYKTKKDIKVIFNIVGNGAEFKKLKKLVAKYGLQEFVIFHGWKVANDLDAIFNISHLALGALGRHRSNLFQNSSLKSREYCARGIPFIESCNIKDIPNDFKYIQYVPPNDSPIIIEDIINFYLNISMNFPDYGTDMRKFAEENLTWINKMQPIIEYIETKEKKLNV